jgi:hypothetical protein
MDIKVAGPAPIICHRPASQTARTGKTLGNQSYQGSVCLAHNCMHFSLGLTDYPDPHVVHEEAEDGEEQDCLAANAVRKDSERDCKQYGCAEESVRQY